MSGAVDEVALHETTRRRYLNYALSVITSRALPDIRDGLKPVQRRIIYAMFEGLRLLPDAKHRKSAAVVGEVMAKYHPHGDQSIYDAMVRMAQDFSLRYPLVDGQGNFGSLDGDGAAAMRYTEARLRHYAVELLSELRKDTVDFRPNYDGVSTEPEVLPAQVPNLLVNGATGIAVGMATQIPPHNLKEVVSALIALIDDPELPLERIVGRYVKGPDFPTGGEILNTRDDLREIYAKGHGAIEVQATWEVEREGRRRQIAVTSIPYAVNKANLVSSIADLIRAGKIPQVVDVRDESTDEVRVVLELKGDANPEAAMAFLFKRTALRHRFNLNMTALCPLEEGEAPAGAPGEALQPRRVDLRYTLQAFLRFRRQVVERRLRHDLAELERRIHLLRAFAIIFDALDEAIRLIRESEDKADARGRLMERFELDHDQAEAILETKLYRLAKLQIEAIRAELEEKEAMAAEIRAILASEEKLWALVRSELEQIREAYGDRRRTKITGPVEMAEFSEEVYIVAEDAFVMITRGGWYKRQKSYTDVSAVRVREGDELGWVVPANTREALIVCTDRGRAYTMRVDDVPQTTGYGEPLQTRFDFADGEHVVGVCTTDARVLPKPPPEVMDGWSADDAPPPHLVVLTKKGRCLRIAPSLFADPSTVSGRLLVRLNGADDAVVGVEAAAGDEYVSLATRQSRALIFPVAEIKVLGSAGKGVLASKLALGDFVMGFALTRHRMEGVEVETNRGRTEVVRPNKYKVTSRGGRGKEIVRSGHVARVIRGPQEQRLRVEGDGAEAPAEGADALPDGTAEEILKGPASAPEVGGDQAALLFDEDGGDSEE